MEIWKDIIGYEGLYQVSNLGRVKSLERIVICGNGCGGMHTVKEKILTPHIEKNGYLRVNLKNLGKSNKLSIHKLVAQAFIPNPNNKQQIDHINTDRTDNRVENLRWVTAKENCNNPLTLENKRFANMGNKNPMYNKRGILHHKSKPVIQLTLNNELIKRWDNACIAHKTMNYNQGNISACCRGKIKKYKGYKWGFEQDYNKIKFNIFNLNIYKKVA